ncbi:hypothetical protein PSP6_510042 [Paraburkholderia tropica]|nr:hypothetical protein PSP6_510042 [Paraburkholderia tropica]
MALTALYGSFVPTEQPLQLQQRHVENRALDRNGGDSYIGLAATHVSAAKRGLGSVRRHSADENTLET